MDSNGDMASSYSCILNQFLKILNGLVMFPLGLGRQCCFDWARSLNYFDPEACAVQSTSMGVIFITKVAIFISWLFFFLPQWSVFQKTDFSSLKRCKKIFKNHYKSVLRAAGKLQTPLEKISLASMFDRPPFFPIQPSEKVFKMKVLF